MNMEKRSALPPNSNEPLLPGKPGNDSGQTSSIRQQLWDRAQRLYAIGELSSAAQLLSELAAASRRHQVEGAEEAIHG